MDEKKIQYNITSALVPNYYQTFHCIMGNCQDNCCDDGWNIYFNKKDYLTVKRATEKNEELQEAVLRGMRRLRGQTEERHYAEFCVTDTGRCAFHTEEGLCRLQMECGAEVLPKVCRVYPRKEIYTSAAKEYSVSPSCEGVLQQLWDLPEGVEFVENPLPKSEQRSATIKLDGNLLMYFAPLRELFIDILQNRTMSLSDRMLCLGIVIEQLKKEDWKTLDAEAWVKRMAELIDAGDIGEAAAAIVGDHGLHLTQNLNILNKIMITGKKWVFPVYRAIDADSLFEAKYRSDGDARGTLDLTIPFSIDAYADAVKQFESAFVGREYFFENLMVAAALYMGFPILDDRDTLWENYVALCNLYSFYRFVSVLGCKENATKEQLFHMIVMASRATLHAEKHFEGLHEELFQNDSTTLAHMAILIKG